MLHGFYTGLALITLAPTSIFLHACGILVKISQSTLLRLIQSLLL